MKRMLLPMAIYILATVLSPCAFGFDVPLKYEPVSNRIPSFNGSSEGEFSPHRPEGEWKLPSTETPLQYALLKLADGVHLLALEQFKPGGKLDFRVYIDRDGDGDLTDEPPLEGKIQKVLNGVPSMGTFGRIEMSVLSGKMRTQHRIVLTLRKNMSEIIFLCSENGVYRGVFTLDGAPVTITLYDRNGNGRFDDLSAAPIIVNNNSAFRVFNPKGDRALISDDGSGDYSDLQPLGDCLWIRSTLFRVNVDIAHNRLTLARITRGLSPVKLPMPLERLSLYDQTHSRYVTIFHPSGDTLMFLPGSYRLMSYQALRMDKMGEYWRLTAQGTQFTPVLNVEANKPASLVLGEPYAPQVVCVAHSYIFFTELSMNLSGVEGAGRERVQSIESFRTDPSILNPYTSRPSGRRPGMPTYTIVKADGELVARGVFRYG